MRVRVLVSPQFSKVSVTTCNAWTSAEPESIDNRMGKRDRKRIGSITCEKLSRHVYYLCWEKSTVFHGPSMENCLAELEVRYYSTRNEHAALCATRSATRGTVFERK